MRVLMITMLIWDEWEGEARNSVIHTIENLCHSNYKVMFRGWICSEFRLYDWIRMQHKDDGHLKKHLHCVFVWVFEKTPPLCICFVKLLIPNIPFLQESPCH